MGNAIVLMSLLHGLVGTNDTSILMVGLNGAGKTAILHRLHLSEMVTTSSEMGFSLETVKYENIYLRVFDVGGQPLINPLAWQYLQNVRGLIFVVDSSDRELFLEVKDLINRLLNVDKLREAVLLVFANKQDLATSANVGQITADLGLHNIRNRPWYIQACSATSGDGLYEGLEWLFDQLRA